MSNIAIFNAAVSAADAATGVSMNQASFKGEGQQQVLQQSSPLWCRGRLLFAKLSSVDCMLARFAPCVVSLKHPERGRSAWILPQLFLLPLCVWPSEGLLSAGTELLLFKDNRTSRCLVDSTSRNQIPLLWEQNLKCVIVAFCLFVRQIINKQTNKNSKPSLIQSGELGKTSWMGNMWTWNVAVSGVWTFQNAAY